MKTYEKLPVDCWLGDLKALQRWHTSSVEQYWKTGYWLVTSRHDMSLSLFNSSPARYSNLDLFFIVPAAATRKLINRDSSLDE